MGFGKTEYFTEFFQGTIYTVAGGDPGTDLLDDVLHPVAGIMIAFCIFFHNILQEQGEQCKQ